jgi:hypothetical protein
MSLTLSPLQLKRIFRVRAKVSRDIAILELILAGNDYRQIAIDFDIMPNQVLKVSGMLVHLMMMDEAWQKYVDHPFTLEKCPYAYSRVSVAGDIHPNHYELSASLLKPADLYAEASFVRLLLDQVKASPNYQELTTKETA